MKIDKTLAASVALHALVIGWGLVSFSTKAFESMPEDSVPVDIVSADQFAKAMAGMKTGKKENPKPMVEKVAEPKPPVPGRDAPARPRRGHEVDARGVG